MDERSDAELLRLLRDGDRRAYGALWVRHTPAALRYAQRLLPSRAEDLVSESFLAVYQQVALTSAGPQFAFRSYLKAVIRNTALRWRKEDEQVVESPDIDGVDVRDGLRALEDVAEATDVFAALQALPERWQKVLWLAEVADVPRPEIARELGIRPNAVSALQRRARAGLQLHWVARQIPARLREDPDHAARLFPVYLTDPDNLAVSGEVIAHLADCADCGGLLCAIGRTAPQGRGQRRRPRSEEPVLRGDGSRTGRQEDQGASAAEASLLCGVTGSAGLT